MGGYFFAFIKQINSLTTMAKTIIIALNNSKLLINGKAADGERILFNIHCISLGRLTISKPQAGLWSEKRPKARLKCSNNAVCGA